MKKSLETQYDEEYLQLKMLELQQRTDALALSNTAAKTEVDGIRTALKEIDKEQEMRARFNLYQLCYRLYIRMCPDEDLLGIFLGIRSRTYRLDRPNKEIWNQERLNAIEKQLGPKIAPQVRSEIEALAKAIDECGFRYTRDSELKSELRRYSLWWTIFAFLFLVAALLIVAFKHVDANSEVQNVPILLFGVTGGLLSATLQQRHQQLYRHTMSTARVELWFRAVFGAVAAIIVTMLLGLRVVDFPFMHAANASGLPISALYIVGFASGFTERLFIGAMDTFYPKKSGAGEKGQDKKQSGPVKV